MMPVVCPVCRKGKNFDFIKSFSKEKIDYSLYLCQECKVQFWYPQKTPGGQWYENRNPSNIGQIITPKLYRGYHKKALKSSIFWLKGANILDVGCGTGEFIWELSKRGFRVFGVDFDKKSIEVAKVEFGLKNVFCASFEEFFQNPDLPKFDVITFFEVFEHLDNHLEFISNLKKVLKPEGKIILSTPSRERVFVDANKWDFPPHHFTRWNEESLKNIFSEAGFKIIFVEYVETLRITIGAIDGKLRSGLVQKSLGAGGSNKKNRFILAKILYFLSKVKQIFIAGIPALIIWAFGKIIKRNNGIIYMELTKI